MKSHYLKIALLSLCAAFFCSALTGCTPRTEVPVRKVKKTSQLKNNATNFNRADLDKPIGGWDSFVQSGDQVMNSRDPFRGFTDIMAAEALIKEQAASEDSEVLALPEQAYPVTSYKVVGVITGTASPKVNVIDPAGSRFVLRVGDHLGNALGVISSIRRDGIEVYERAFGDKGRYIDLKLYQERSNDKKRSNNIHLDLQ